MHHSVSLSQVIVRPSAVDEQSLSVLPSVDRVIPARELTNEATPSVGTYGSPSLRLYTLGTFQLLLDLGQGQPNDLARAHQWGHGRALDLLLLMLLRRRPLRRQEVASILWPLAESDKRARLLRNALWNLRRSLSQHANLICEGASTSGIGNVALVVHESSHALSIQIVSGTEPIDLDASLLSRAKEHGPSSYWCDLHAFEAAMLRVHDAVTIEERIGRIQTARNLYGGPFLAHRREMVRNAGASDWISEYRARAQAQWVHLTTDLAALFEQKGAYEHALDALRQLLEVDPLNGNAVRQSMQLLRELHRVDEALVMYESFRRLHRDTFHKDPGELKVLARQLRARPSTIRAAEA